MIAVREIKKNWKLLNDLTLRKRNKTRSPTEIEINGITTQNSTQIAEAFSPYFSSVGSNLESQIPHSNTTLLSYMGERVQSSFFASPSTAKEVEIIISELNCRSGHSYTIPQKIFVKFDHVLSKPISDLFNLSISTGVFPDLLKIARVIPNYKSDSKNTEKL